MGANSKRTGKSTSANSPKPPGSKKRTRKVPTKRDYISVVRNYLRNGHVKTLACVQAGFSPYSATDVFARDDVKKLIAEIEAKLPQEIAEQEAKERVMTVRFLDEFNMHIIANGQTHFMRGDADRVKAIENGYKSLDVGGFKAPVVKVSAQAGAIAGGTAPATMRAAYKAQWLIDKENEMRLALEGQDAARQLPAAIPNGSTAASAQ